MKSHDLKMSAMSLSQSSLETMAMNSNVGRITYHRKTNNMSTVMIAMSFVGLSCGYTLAFTSRTLLNYDKELSHKTNKHKIDITWYVSLLFLGAFFAAPIAGLLCDRIGRKLTVVLSVLPAVCSWISTAVSATYEILPLMLAGQFIAGISLAFVFVGAPIYLAEVCPAALRGRYFCYKYASLEAGILATYGLGLGLSIEWQSTIGILIHAIAAGTMAILPDSPRYLFTKNRRTEALLSLEWLRCSDEDIEGEFLELETILSFQEPMECSHYNNPAIYKPMLLSILISTLTPLCGIVVFYIYNHYMLFVYLRIYTLPHSYNPAYRLISVFAQILMAFLAAFLSSKIGRRFMLALSSILTFIACLAVGLFCFLTRGRDFDNTTRFAVYIVATSLYNMSYSLALGPIVPALIAEMLPLRVRAHACGISVSMASLLIFTLSKVFVDATRAIKTYGVFWTFGAGGAFLAIFIIAFLPDISNQSLEEIELCYENGRFVRRDMPAYNSIETRICESQDSTVSLIR